jgi:ComEC/Rec2-related protein
MSFVYFLLFSLVTAAYERFSVHSLFHPLILFFHQSCLSRLPSQSSALPELQALVCGQNFSDPKSSQIYIATGLIHLFVVSGAHLILLEGILDFFKIYSKSIPRFLILTALFIYVLACDFNPPIVRSFLSMLASIVLFQNKLRWPISYKIFLTGMLTLCIDPTWASSVSLQLSWVAGLIVSLNSLYFSKSGFFLKQSLFYIFLWPFLIFLSIPSPLVILVNLIFAPALEFILFPLGLAVWVAPFLHPLFDWTITALNQILKLLEFQMNTQSELDTNKLALFGWIFILFLHFTLHLVEMNQRKQFYV